VIDDELTELRRAVVPGFVEVAGVDHGADRARQALRTQWRRRGGGARWRAVGRRGSVPNRGSRWRSGRPRLMRHRRPAQTVLGDTLRHPFTFTHDTVGHIGRRWRVSWSEGPMCLAGRSTFRPMNPPPRRSRSATPASRSPQRIRPAGWRNRRRSGPCEEPGSAAAATGATRKPADRQPIPWPSTVPELSAGGALYLPHRSCGRPRNPWSHRKLWRRWDSNPRPPACKAGALAN
jgi:hypothetical protein